MTYKTLVFVDKGGDATNGKRQVPVTYIYIYSLNEGSNSLLTLLSSFS